ncbi:helix-turn-helix domain-containing protein [Klebsiella pneumoniae]|uniref:helix-turn-helix domain-containing protein n=1 Tax=Enterobacteriaceae TaxID=543 RepID=UPI002005564A|nr:helix-turn-helix domain-containing protein [Enterobacter roggenkampii]MCK6844202.1 helix-turn-helix domain-containing protein [Enterobacter roggenkampii]
MRATTLRVGPGTIIKVGDALMCVKRWETTTSVVAREVATLLDRVVTLAEITRSMANDQTGDQIDLSAISEEDWDAAVERYRAISPLIESRERTLDRVTEVADALGVSAATVYRWLARIARYGTVSCLLRKQRSDKGSKRLAEPVEAIVSAVIAGEYLTDQRRSPTAALREIERLCRQHKLVAPSKGTLLRRIDEILPEEKVRKRHGRNASLDFRATRGTLPGVDHVHAIWQIDHTKVDITLVDEKDRIPIGRPWITVAIDVFTRMVVGWYISFDPPGTLATGICIATAILPKDAPLARLGADYPWPCQGKTTLIHGLRRLINESGLAFAYERPFQSDGVRLLEAAASHQLSARTRPVRFYTKEIVEYVRAVELVTGSSRLRPHVASKMQWFFTDSYVLEQAARGIRAGLDMAKFWPLLALSAQPDYRVFIRVTAEVAVQRMSAREKGELRSRLPA